MNYKKEIRKLSDMPDHFIEHMAQLEISLRQSIAPHIEGQRKDLVICAAIIMTANLIVDIFNEDLDWLKENQDMYAKNFETSLEIAIRHNYKEKGLTYQPQKGE